MRGISFSKVIQEACIQEAGTRELVGGVRDIETFLAPESLAKLEKHHDGVYCFAVFHPRIDEHVAAYLASDAPAVDAGQHMLLLFPTQKEIRTPRQLKLQDLDIGIELAVKEHPAGLLLATFYPGPDRVALPGLVFCGSVLDVADAVYVPLADASTVADTARRCREVFLLAERAYLRTPDKAQFIPALAALLDAARIHHQRSGSASAVVLLSTAYRSVAARRGDLGTVVSDRVSREEKGKMMRYLESEEIEHVRDAALRRRLDRDVLLGELPVDYASDLPRHPALKQQLDGDLTALNAQEPLVDGTVPLQVWLRKALSLSRSYTEGAIFERALRKVEQKVLDPEQAALSEVLSSLDDDALRGVAQSAGQAPPADAFTLVRAAAPRKGGLDALISAAVARRIDGVLLDLAAKRGLAAATPAAIEKAIKDSAPAQDPGPWSAKFHRSQASVCRIDVAAGGGWARAGTGFLVGPDLVLTNHHVIADLAGQADASDKILFRFGVRRAVEGGRLEEGPIVAPAKGSWLLAGAPPSQHELGVPGAAAEPAPHELDFALIRLARPLGDELEGPSRRGWIEVRESTALAPYAVGQPLLILGYPAPEPLKLTGGKITEIRGPRLRYDAGSDAGSSGSACFNFSLDLVGLHNGSVPGMEANQGVPVQFIARFCREKHGIEFPAYIGT